MRKFKIIILFICIVIPFTFFDNRENFSSESLISKKDEMELFTHIPFTISNNALLSNILDFYPKAFIYEVGKINDIQFIDLEYMHCRIILQLINNDIYKVIYQIVNNKNMIYINDLSCNISIYEVTPSKKLEKYDYYLNPFLYFKDNIHEYTNKLTGSNERFEIYESVFNFTTNQQELLVYENITLTELACIYKISLYQSIEWGDYNYLPYERINIQMKIKQDIDFQYERYIKSRKDNKVIYSTSGKGSNNGSMQLSLLQTSRYHIFNNNIYNLNIYQKPHFMELCDQYYFDLGEKILNED